MTEFNPADHTVDEVKTHLESNPQDTQAVLDAEKARGDDARSTLVSSLEAKVADQPEVPVAVEPAPVEVSPADQSTTDKVFGVDYTVTPEQGYRRS